MCVEHQTNLQPVGEASCCFQYQANYAYLRVGQIPGAAWDRIVNVFSRNGSSSQLVPGGGLSAHEGVKLGRTLKFHVGQSFQRMWSRLGDVKAASLFPNREVAERAISETMKANQSKISNWLAGAGKKVVLDQSFLQSVGVVLTRAQNTLTPASRVTMVLQRDPSQPLGYFIKTGYPKL